MKLRLLTILAFCSLHPLLPQSVLAQQQSACEGASISPTIEIEIQLPDGDGDFAPNSVDQEDFFNERNCECSGIPQSEFQIEVNVTAGLDTLSDNATVQLWIGTDCDDSDDQQQFCGDAPQGDWQKADLDEPVTVRVPTSLMVNPPSGTCVQDKRTRSIYVLVDDDNNRNYECSFVTAVAVDSEPPPTVETPEATGGEKSINVQWELPDNATDIAHFQALCQLSANNATVDDSPDDAEFNIPCDGENSLFREKFICGTAPGTAEELKIDNLENGTEYNVQLLVIDKAGNFTVAQEWNKLVPRSVTDFWELYAESGGTAEGEFCLINSTYGNHHPFANALRQFRDDTLAYSAWGRWVTTWYYAHLASLGAVVEKHSALRIALAVLLTPPILVILWYQYTGLAGILFVLFLALWWRTKRRRHSSYCPPGKRVVIAASIVSYLFLPIASSHAQPYQPYWEKFDAQQTAVQPETVNWNIGFKLGLYKPEIDKGANLTGTPYATTFRKQSKIMGVLELDRFLLHAFGQLGVTASIGLTGNSANSFNTTATGTDTDSRSDGDKTRFRLVPTSLGVVYRFTELDDRWHIPFVPYGKLALSYYIWWIKGPNGTAEVGNNKGRGATLGYQATIGLAIRAERIDPRAASSLRNDLGIDHAGLYAEWTIADVDGFGSDKRLRVGDRTFFAGFNFEF